MTILQQIILAVIAIVTLAFLAVAVLMGVVTYFELVLRDIDAEGVIEENINEDE